VGSTECPLGVVRMPPLLGWTGFLVEDFFCFYISQHVPTGKTSFEVTSLAGSSEALTLNTAQRNVVRMRLERSSFTLWHMMRGFNKCTAWVKCVISACNYNSTAVGKCQVGGRNICLYGLAELSIFA